MTFVVVWLIRAKEFIVVDENWVQDLNSAKLKNYGANRNQTFLVFWSGINGVANLQTKCNFDAPLSSTYHATVDEICYLCSIKKFFGKFGKFELETVFSEYIFHVKTDNQVDANEWMHRQRYANVAVYNPARLVEQPIPNINQPGNGEEEINDVEADPEIHELVIVALERFDEIAPVAENDGALQPEAIFANDEIGIEQLNRPNEPEIEDEPNGGYNEIDPLLIVKDEVLEPVNGENIEKELVDLFVEATIEVEPEHHEIFGSDDECEMTWDGVIAAPMHFDVKIDDPISGNKFFTVHVSITVNHH